MATEEHEPLVAVNVSVDGSQKMAGFEVSINGRFWVSTEDQRLTPYENYLLSLFKIGTSP